MDDVARRTAEQACIRDWVDAIRAGDARALAQFNRSDTSYGVNEARAALMPVLDGDYQMIFDEEAAYTRRYWLVVGNQPVCAVRMSYSIREGTCFVFGFDRLA